MKEKKEKGYDIQFDVDDKGVVTFTGSIDTKFYRTKATNQIYTAMYNSTRMLIEAWEKHYE